MHTNTIGKKGKIAALLGAFAVVLSGAISPLTAQADDPANVETWGELEAALASHAETITITGDFAAKDGETLNVTYPVIIQGDATIYRDSKASTYEPMFTVSGDGNLTLAGGIKLSGKGMTCGLEPVKHDEGWVKHPADERYWIVDDEHPDGYSPVEGKRVMLGFAESNRADVDPVPGIAYIGDKQICNDGQCKGHIMQIADESGVIEQDSDGKWRLKEALDESKYVFTVTEVDHDEYGAAWFNAASGEVIGRTNELVGDLAPVIVVDKDNPGLNEGAYKIENESNFKFSMGGLDGTTQKYIIPNNKQAEAEADKQDYAVAGAKPQVNLNYGWNKTWLWVDETYWTVDGANEADGSPTKFLTEKEAQDWADANGGSGGDSCTLEQTCSKVTGTQFKGARGDEKGFFVQVNGGTFNLTGNAELRDLITDETVTYAAPVVSKGGKVNISGGTITHNSVGYSAKNGDSGLIANKIGKEAQDSWGETGKLAEYANTETAGAIILTEKSEGVISGGTISGNRGDTGAIVVQGKPDRDRSGAQNRNVDNGNATASTLLIQNGAIDNNVGVHHAGGVYAFNGADVEMTGGFITNNFAWNKGGGVWVSEESYASLVSQRYAANHPEVDRRLAVGNATFILKGGTLSGNMAVNRGGALEVMSDHVALMGGELINNYSRVLGGAVYVEGDGAAERSYHLFIEKGCITDNHAVPDSNNATSAPLYRTLNRGTDCDFSNEMNGATAGNVSDRSDFAGHYGHGGGVWLCALGGETVFAVPNAEVSLWANTAPEKRGKDLAVVNVKKGNTNGFSFLDLGTQEFADENRDGVVYSEATVKGRSFNGPIYATAQTTGTCSAGGVRISGNVASNGGGIAADGNVVFGKNAEIAQAFMTLKLTKAWSSEREQKPVTFKLYAQVGDERVELTDYGVTLNGTSDTYNEDEQLGENEYGENSSGWEVTTDNDKDNGRWVGETGLPLSVVVNGETVPLFTFDDNGTTLDPSKINDLVTIAKKVQSGDLTKGNLTGWKLVVDEIIDGEVQEEHVVDLGNGVLENLQYLGNETNELKDRNNTVIGTLTTYQVGLDFATTIGNDITPSTEKYVNKDVHSDIVEFDKEFTYDVMAYVPLDATKVTITDTLVKGLEFADAEGNATTDVSKAVQSVVVKPTNDHKPGGTVAQVSNTKLNLNVANSEKTNPATIDGSTLTVTIDREQALSAARGKWIQVTFNARIQDKYRNLDALKELAEGNVKSWQPVAANENVPVLSDKPHEGMANKATYTVYTPSNEGGSDYETNTVTVTPETTQIMVEKKWNVNGSAEWPAEVKNVTFGVFQVKGDAETPVMVDKDGKVVPAGTDGAKKLAVELNAGKPTDAVTGLPKLEGVTYVAREIKVGDTDVTYTDTNPNSAVIKVSDLLELIATTVANTVNDIATFTATNETPQIEKYINQDVDAHLETFDEVITYDILAYVPLGADSLEITDPLVDSLEFADASGNASIDPAAVVESVVVKETNDHTALTGTVASTDGTPLGDAAAISFADAGKRLNVTIADASAYRGKWIQVTFHAKYTEDAIRAAKVAPPADNADVTDNGTVISEITEHDGTANKASYKVKVGNTWTSDHDSNTVTHDSETIELKATKAWQDRNGNALDTWLDGVSVTFALMKGDQQIETKTLSQAGTVTFTAQPKLKGVTYTVVETAVTGVDATQVGDPAVENNVWTFTNKLSPDTPRIEKYINKDVHQEVALDEVFTYDIIAYATSDATKLTISDELIKNLEFADGADKVVVTDLGTSNNHKTNGTYTGTNADATVSAAGDAVEATSTIDGKKLTVVVDDVEGQGLRGHYVRVTFRAKLSADAEYVTITDNGTVLSDREHTGVDNTASYIVDTAHGPYDVCESNTVTVKPNEAEIEKYVNQAVHKDITLDEVFTYDLIAWVTNDADTVTITDELMGDLAFASTADAVKVEALGADDNHKVVNNVDGSSAGNDDATVAAAGTAVEGAEVTIDGQTLTVTIPDATAVRGQWVRVTFDAKIAEGKTLADIKGNYAAIDATAVGERAEPNVGNAPVLSDENHNGLPNTASYEIGVKQAVLDENGNPKVDENGNVVEELKKKYEDESNTVTVKPKHEIEFSKWQFGIKTVEIPGAYIVIRDAKGNIVEEWTSTDEVHKFYLAEGEYEFEEVNAPEGFNAITTRVKFTVDENGTVTVTNAEEIANGRVTVIDHNHLILEDKLGNISKSGMLIAFAKVDENMEPLAGAQLKVTNKETGEVYAEWTTDGTEYVLADRIFPGVYVLEETAAPAGYLLADPIEFEVMFDGTVVWDGKVHEEPVVTMVDKVDTGKTPGPKESKSATPDVRTRSLVTTGASAVIPLLGAVLLIGIGAGVLAFRRRRS